VLTSVLDSTSNPQGKYTDDEKRNRATFLNRLGNVYSEQNKVAEAVATYKQMADLGGDYAHDGYMGEVEAYREAHQYKDAFAAAETAAKAEPKDHGVQMVYAEQLADMGQVDQALTLAKAQLTGGADDRETLENLASIYLRLKRYKEAGQQLDKAELLSTKPLEKLDVYYIRGELYDRQKMYDQAEATYREALAIDPQNAGVLNNLGYMLADQGQKLPEALKMIRRAVELEPQNPAYLDSLGWVYFKTGQYPQAEENLRKAIERTSGDPAILDHLGEVYEKTGNLKLAVAQWERSMTEYARSLPADADPEDVAKVQRKLESARVKLAKLTSSADKDLK
jgi:tetratricopeptide (TPR) repeat protein